MKLTRCFILAYCSAGSAKKAARVMSSSPLTSKCLKNGNNTINSPSQPLMLEKNSSNGSLKPISLAKKLQASENDDPNSPVNQNPEVVPKAAKPAPVLARQRSVKAHEVKPALTRQRSQKLLETKQTAPAVDTHAVRKASGESHEFKSSSEKEAVLRKENSVKAVATSSHGSETAKANTTSVTSCKTPVKEAVSNQHEMRKPVSCIEIAGSPYSGHHCKSSRCAANDPIFSSPVPSKKYLVAKRGTPGSLRKATPTDAGGEKCHEDTSDEAHKERKNEMQIDASKVKAHSKVALTAVFQKMALDQSHDVVEKQTTSQVIMTAVTELSKSEVEDLKEVPLGEDRSAVTLAQSISAEDVRAWAGRSVSFEEKAASSSERPRTDTEMSTNEESKETGIEKFLQVASECLEKIDLNKLDLPQSKQGKKRFKNCTTHLHPPIQANCSD